MLACPDLGAPQRPANASAFEDGHGQIPFRSGVVLIYKSAAASMLSA
jgi:hypothetical protein